MRMSGGTYPQNAVSRWYHPHCDVAAGITAASGRVGAASTTEPNQVSRGTGAQCQMAFTSGARSVLRNRGTCRTVKHRG